MSSKTLNDIQEQAIASNLARVFIQQGNHVLLDWGKPQTLLQSYSITKSIMGLAMGLLWDQKLINELHTPIYHFFPEWDQGYKQQVTLWHLLTHTSGLQDDPTYEDIIRAPDSIQLALCAELTSLPGEKYNYNNKATNLIPGVIERITGKSAENFINESLFNPLKIQNFEWRQDKKGNIYGAAGLKIAAEELIKIGKLVLDKGQWDGNSLLSHEWLSLMTTKTSIGTPACGLLWWIYENPTIIAAQGYLGQRLYIYPEKQIIGVQQYDRDENPSNQPHNIVDLRELITQL
ncbi:MAG: hypothetical protein BGO76_02235 [Caedibacter sp. 38-128]|nr:serine hydrolase [Holosporales bacterium]OJX08557.1 MAG: hypothetical protein BGO76_02235 [Caedibacter sp. 38-128]